MRLADGIVGLGERVVLLKAEDDKLVNHAAWRAKRRTSGIQKVLHLERQHTTRCHQGTYGRHKCRRSSQWTQQPKPRRYRSRTDCYVVSPIR